MFSAAGAFHLRPPRRHSPRPEVPIRRFLRPAAAALVAALSTWACGDDGPPTTPGPNQPPTVEVTAPPEGSVHPAGEPIGFAGTATDPEEGTLEGASLSWTSSEDGTVASGAAATVTGLSAGTHTVTLTATDAGGAQGSDEVQITVEDVTSDGTIALLPEDWEMPGGRTVRFRAERAPDAPAGELVWSVDGIEGGNERVGTIDAEGVYTAPPEPPPSNPVRVRARVEGSEASFATAPVSVADEPGTLDIRWERFEPRVVSTVNPGPVSLEVSVAGHPEALDIETPGDVLELRPLRTGVWGIELTAEELLAGYERGDLHEFLGLLRLRRGGEVFGPANLFVNVRDAGVPAVDPEPLAEDARATDHVLNLRHDDLFPGAPIPAEVIRRFYELLPDDFDFIAVVEQFQSHHNRNYRAVRNDVEGLGSPQFDNSADFGSAGRLQGLIDYPIDHFFDLATTASVHEIGHRWMAFVSEPSLDNGTAHWPLSSVARGVMGISVPPTFQGSDFPFEVVHVEGDTYELRCAELPTAFNDLELYLMGLLPPGSVDPHVVFDDQEMERGCGATGTATEVTVEDVIAADGPRVPDHESAQRDFRIATVVLSRGRLLSDEEMAFFDHMAARGEAREELRFTSGFLEGMTKPFYLATGGRATLSTRLRP